MYSLLQQIHHLGYFKSAMAEGGIHQTCSYINNKLLWVRKYARIVVRGYYLFREANSCLSEARGQL